MSQIRTHFVLLMVAVFYLVTFFFFFAGSSSYTPSPNFSPIPPSPVPPDTKCLGTGECGVQHIDNLPFPFEVVEGKAAIVIPEIGAVATVLRHTKTGAKILKLFTATDDNKVFTIGFRTTPTDNTGCPHIAEHSVLCGSRNYQTKQPFLDLAKSSMHTFLNALTFPDKTIYPVGSRNVVDFHNLMNVYLDAVFHPRIYSDKNIFLQEGWRPEMKAESDPITITGVVYNEMQGVFSSPDEYLGYLIQTALFPDTPYRFSAGGIPDDIITLQWEDFLVFHHDNYHPSNSYTILYGNGYLSEELAILDKYFSEYSKEEPSPCIQMQEKLNKPRTVTAEYPIGDSEDESGKTYLALAWQVGNSWDSELMLGMIALQHILFFAQGALLKEALLKAGIGRDVICNFEEDIAQPFLYVVLKGSDDNKTAAFQEITIQALLSIVKNGIPQDLIQASLNKLEFSLREADFRGFPKGVAYSFDALRSWLYDKDPISPFQWEQTLADIKEKASSGFFEELIARYLITNTHSCLIVLSPKKGLEQAKKQALDNRLLQYKASLSKEQLQLLISQTLAFKIYQDIEDTPEAISTIPVLSISDVEKTSMAFPVQMAYIPFGPDKFIPSITHEAQTNGIVYARLLFDFSHVPTEKLPFVSLLAYTLGKMGTLNNDYNTLDNKITVNSGGMSVSPQLFNQRYSDTLFSSSLVVAVKFFPFKATQVMDLISEVLTKTSFSDHTRLLELVRKLNAAYAQKISQNGMDIVISDLMASFSPAGAFRFHLSGLGYVKWLKELENSWSEDIALELENTLVSLSTSIFDVNRLIVASTSDSASFPSFFGSVNSLTSRLPAKSQAVALPVMRSMPLRNKTKDGLIIPTTVHCVAQGFNTNKIGTPFSGAMLIISKILSLNYLWVRIRDQGGAYGAYAVRRDPNLINTLKVFADSAEWLRSVKLTQKDLDRFIIGTIGDVDSPLTPSMEGEKAISLFLSNITQYDVQRERDEVFGCTLGQVQAFASVLRDLIEHASTCVLGPESSLEEARTKGLLSSVYHI